MLIRNNHYSKILYSDYRISNLIRVYHQFSYIRVIKFAGIIHGYRLDHSVAVKLKLSLIFS